MTGNEAYRLETHLRRYGMERDFEDLKIKLRNSIATGTHLDDKEVHLCLMAFSHAAGIEKAFSVCFATLENHEVVRALCKTEKPGEDS